MPTLDTLRSGQQARILEVNGDDSITLRLMEMGMTAGEDIELLGRAPMGDPLEFGIRGYRLSLRIVEAQRVEVQILDAAS